MTVYAVWLVTARGLWRRIGATVQWRSWTAVLVLAPLALEAVEPAMPAGLAEGWTMLPRDGVTPDRFRGIGGSGR